MRADRRGFTLIELMVTVAIVGVLAAIAYPSYTSHFVKSNRAQAQAVLMEIAQKESTYVVDTRTYTNSLSTLGVTVPDKVLAQYTIEITAPTSTPPSYTATATPISTGRQVADGALSIDSSGAKSPSSKW
ncbi:type IV pilin protein [Noviherbaspirillum galbum]|uniref:Type IV pilin protein n=1 Tax=Noviherbaspirillum galbum TaxID=2709383 RepID=A0A6B3SHX5_9BURK|nr:type IV pilin protein [Noviherbaspirillum galbum]NEX60288.1 type IV pilin protein [Noviherbaspirillum galbum]